MADGGDRLVKNFRYLHFVARFKQRYMSGVFDATPEMTPVEIHDKIQRHLCRQWHLSDMHKDDIVVEKMVGIE